ncbi:MAG: DnaJ domain-containing protein, partial [bacterium]|nr:DnaJ domain-containing protein [bacterium]
ACRHTIHSELFCPDCAKVQPLPTELNFFELLELPVRLNLDGAELERRYHTLSRQLHPDFFQQKSDPERDISLERFAAINQAYHALRTMKGRARYLLELHRHKSRDQARQDTPKSLLMTVFELQEATEELADLPEDAPPQRREAARERVRAIGAELDQKQADVDARLQRLADQWDAAGAGPGPVAAGGSEPAERLLDRIRALLDEDSYLARLRRNIDQALGEIGAGHADDPA